MATANGYYDVLLFGRTGQGKSTLGNKLLQVDGPSLPRHGSLRTIKNLATVDSGMQQTTRPTHVLPTPSERQATSNQAFRTADDVPETDRTTSVTRTCEIALNTKSKIRVIDAPGFADTSSLSDHSSVYLANLQIIRQVIRIRNQLQYHNKTLQVRRVVYFFPLRGPAEKADGTLQEEIKVLHYYFGITIFHRMVIVATQNIDYQDILFQEKYLIGIQKIFKIAVKQAIGVDIDSPPVVYIGLKDSHKDVKSKIKGANVIENRIFSLSTRDKVCLRCSGTTEILPSGQLSFKVSAETEAIEYNDSMCHPRFLFRSGPGEKAIGTIVHVVTLGIPYLFLEIGFGIETWAGLTNKDEICPHCQQFPGTKGCCEVNKPVDIQIRGSRQTVDVDHYGGLDD